MHDSFRRVQDEYFRLRGQFSVGLIDAQQFDNALQQLSLQDAQGRSWMIGANSGKWYVYDGTKWTEADPYQIQTSHSVPNRDERADAVPQIEIDYPQSQARGMALPFLFASIILLFVASLAFFLLNFDSTSFADAQSLPTRISPQTVIAIGATQIPQTATPTRTRALATIENPNANVTPLPLTVTPPPLELEPTITRPALTAIPTITPGGAAINSSEPDMEVASEIGDSDLVGATDSPAEAPHPGNLPPDVYVTGLAVSPDPPPQRQEVTFTATLLNTNPSAVGMEWRVVFLNPAKQGRNKDWGQSQLVGINVPPGQHTFSLSFTPVTSTGPCVTLQALVARGLSDGGRFFLPSTFGGAYATDMTFC